MKTKDKQKEVVEILSNLDYVPESKKNNDEWLNQCFILSEQCRTSK